MSQLVSRRLGFLACQMNIDSASYWRVWCNCRCGLSTLHGPWQAHNVQQGISRMKFTVSLSDLGQGQDVFGIAANVTRVSFLSTASVW